MEVDPGGDGICVILENISKLDDSTFPGNNKVVLSLVNVEEESALKNRKAFEVINNSVEYKRPPVTLNLYVLFASNINDYETGLMALTKIMAYFQAKNFFTFAEDPPVGNAASIEFSEEEQDIFDIRFDLYTMTFEQLNHLWGSLGGKQVPSTLYKVRVVPVERDQLLEEGRIIKRVRRDGNVN